MHCTSLGLSATSSTRLGGSDGLCQVPSRGRGYISFNYSSRSLITYLKATIISDFYSSLCFSISFIFQKLLLLVLPQLAFPAGITADTVAGSIASSACLAKHTSKGLESPRRYVCPACKEAALTLTFCPDCAPWPLSPSVPPLYARCISLFYCMFVAHFLRHTSCAFSRYYL